MTLARRTLLAGGLAAFAAGVVETQTPPSPAHSDPANSTVSLDDLIRIIGRNDGGVSIRWTDGILTAHIDSVTTPLFRVMSQIFSRHRQRRDGGYDSVVFELAYFADLETRELLENWRNPFTQSTVAVPKTVLGPTPYVITPERIAKRELQYSGGAPFNHRFAIDRSADDLWITEMLDAVMPSPAPGVPGFGFHENFVYQASAADLADRSQTHVAASVQKVNVLGWRPWMLMGNIKGTTMTRAYGRVIDDIRALPETFRRLNAVHGQGLVDQLDGVLRFID